MGGGKSEYLEENTRSKDEKRLHSLSTYDAEPGIQTRAGVTDVRRAL